MTFMKTVREEIEESRELIDALVHKHRGISASIFGSVARGEETANSDIDFLVEFEKGSSLFDLLHLQNDLQVLLGSNVDVVSVGGLKKRDDHLRLEAVSI